MELISPNFLVELPKMDRWRRAAGQTHIYLVWVVAIGLLVSAGITYRLLASRLKHIADNPVVLPVPLSNFPQKIGNWAGIDLSIPNTTKEYMEEHFADDFLSRRYVNTTANVWADVYVVYCLSQPAGILGHKPQICYPAHGWIHDSTETSQFVSQSGRHIRCLTHRFHKPAPTNEQTVVLNFYILNGRITAEESDFSSLFGRRPNIAGDPARYVAQVQISSTLENSVRMAGEEMAELILDFLPDKDGKVKAAEFIQISPSSNVKSKLLGNN